MAELTAVLIITALILLNGLFVAAEFAIVGAPRLAIEKRARAGERIARIVRRILNDPRDQDRFIATAQLGITFASLGLGMYGEHILAGWIAGALEGSGMGRWIAAHAVATAASITILTYFHIVVGEMIPKSLALQHAERTVLWITPPMLAVRKLFYPLVIGLNGLGNGLLRLIGIDRQHATHERYYTAEELKLVVAESEEAGALPRDSSRLLHEIFEFSDLAAAQVMTPRVRVVGIPANSGSREIEGLIRVSPHTRYPVSAGGPDQVVGMVHIKDLLRIVVSGDVLGPHHVRPLATVPETAGLDAVLSTMRHERTQMALVVDEYGGTAGLLTLEDLVEEIVGEVEDEGTPGPGVYHDGSGRLRVPGTARLSEVGELLSVTLQHDEVESVSGLVLGLLGRPPHIGDLVTYAGLRFEVTSVFGRGVGECAVTRVR
jgi:CBS domain containing-hemolysin-like protein